MQKSVLQLSNMEGKVFWRSHIFSSIRTAVACLIAALLLNYAHGYVKWTSFPVFSFVLSFVLVGESSLSRVLRDSFSVIIGAVQGLTMGIIVINLLGPSVSLLTNLACIFFSCLVISYPSFTSLLSKRIALIVASHLHVVAYTRQQNMDRVFYPLKFGCTISLGVICSIIALTFPLPRLASIKARQQIKYSTRMISTCFDSLLDAFVALDNIHRQSIIYKAKTAVQGCAKAISNIESLHMEETRLEQCFRNKQFSHAHLKRLRKLVLHLKSMETGSKEAFPEFVRDLLQGSVVKVRAWNGSAFKLLETGKVISESVLQEGHQVIKELNKAFEVLCKEQTSVRISSMFFLHSMKLFLLELICLVEDKLNKSKPVLPVSTKHNCSKHTVEAPPKPTFKQLFMMHMDTDRLIEATKVSLAMVISAIAGYMYNKPYTIWATLIVGMGYHSFQDGSLRISNVRLHGIVLGTLYGYVVSVYTNWHQVLSILALGPWILFASLVRYNKFYGPVGSASTLIGAIFLVGHEKKTSLSDLAMTRMTESVLGIASFVVVEALIFPRKPSILARNMLVNSLGKIDKCMTLVVDVSTHECCKDAKLCEFERASKEMSTNILQLSSLVNEAKLSTYSWEAPFEGHIYMKILNSQQKLVYILEIIVHNILVYREGVGQEDIKELIHCEAFSKVESLRQRLLGGAPSKHPQQDIENQIKDSNIWRKLVSVRHDHIQKKSEHNIEAAFVYGALMFANEALLVEITKIEKQIYNL